MTVNPDPTKTLTDRHTELLDELNLMRKTIGQLMKKTSPQLLEVFKSESLFVLRDMEEHISCEEEEALFPVLRSALKNRSGTIISMSGDHANLKEEIEKLRIIITNLEVENIEECRRAIDLADTEIDFLIDLFSRHIHKQETFLFQLAREILLQNKLAEIQERLNELETKGESFS